MKRFLAAVSLCMLIPLAFSGPIYADGDKEETEEEAAARRAAWDTGPRTIDVSNYPEELKKNYKIFAEKCSQCHNIARPINADFKPDDWERYIKRMMRKPGSGILPRDGKKINEFLKYYTQEKQKMKDASCPPQGPEE